MCKHILNAQVSMRAPCCRKWYDCRACHNEAQDHELKKEWILIFGCKKCKKVWRQDMRDFQPDSDGFCPGCDNEFFIPAKTADEQGGFMITVEGDTDMVRDDRVKQRNKPGTFLQDQSNSGLFASN